MPPPDTEPVRFEQALAELERILRDLEDGTISLDDSLARYERGVGLLRLCYGQLKDAEQKVRRLAGTTDDGGPDLQPFEHTPSIELARASVRKSSRSGQNPGIPD